VSEQAAVPVEDMKLDFQFRVGASLLEEFAVSHTPADVLRELVQNEYDAGGTELRIDFGTDSLVIRGNGNPIDEAGWDRLSVMLGTGLVAGLAQGIRPKVNGIGSKNFGLRSMFLFGDRIRIISGGRQTILDRTRGTLAKPLPHPESRGGRGVTLRVPYRQTGDGPLRAFSKQFEAEALEAIITELAPTLVKLAHPGPGKDLRAVVLHSARLGYGLRWRQSARADQKIPNLLRRTARVDVQGAQLADVPEVLREVEYQHVVSMPAGLERPAVPGYFRVPGGRIRLAISLRVRRGRLDLRAPGIFYYPIGAGRSRTGFPFSISAPFQMTPDRSQIVDPQNSLWNAWLIKEAAAFAIRLLPERLFLAFGPDSFLAFNPKAANSAIAPLVAEEIERLLRSEPCWPTQATAGRTKRLVCAVVTSTVVPVNQALADFCAGTVTSKDLLHAHMVTRMETRSLATQMGAKSFTVGSLIRLRCAGASNQEMATKLAATEESRRFTSFPDALRNLRLQQRFATAIDACRRELNADNKKDLRRSATTMTAAETLGSPDTPLWISDDALADVVPSDRILHPGLTSYKVLPALCKPFKFSSWVVDTANRIGKGLASEKERGALLQYIRGHPTLSQKAWGAIRHAPVLPDHRGEFCAPANMVSPSAKGAVLLEPALHLTTSADEANESLRPLRFRTTVQGADLIALARLVEQGTISPTVMRRALTHLDRLLTPAVLDQLKSARFLETERGSIMAPVDVYVRSDRLVTVLGEEAQYAVSLPRNLLQRLGCRVYPRADDIIARLVKLREASDHMTRFDVVYRELVMAFLRERRQASHLRGEAIISIGARWEAPEDCLVGRDNQNVFVGAVTVLPEGLRDAWVFLGVPDRPTESHWGRLLMRAGELYGAQQQVPQRVVEALRRAYRNLDGLPEQLRSSTKCLLDDQRRLHAPDEAAEGTLLFNDDPALAAAARSANLPVAFADTSDQQARQFFNAIGTRRLSAVATETGTEYGSDLPPNDPLRVTASLTRLHDPHFGSAVAALASETLGARIKQISIVDGIKRQYNLSGHIVSVASGYDVRDDLIVLDRVASPHELRRSVADAVAIIAGSSKLGDTIYFLLRSKSIREMKRELERRKIAWQPELSPTLDDNEGPDETEDIDDVMASLADAISRNAIRDALSGGTGTTSTSPAPTQPPEPAPTPNVRPALPDLGAIQPRPAAATGRPSHRSSGAPGGGGSGSWSPRSQAETEYDRLIGRRGEEIIANIERERVKQLGFPPERVVWAADITPGADHDIKSVDDDGEDLWIEVKSTTSRNGNFRWPVAEFRLAVRARHRYVLYRVYEADTTAPSWSRIRDPIGSFDTGRIRLDLDQLVGDVGPLVEHQEADDSAE
jgi:Protein NO VEIN, C-terminal